jgi:hypothetical protein
VQGSFNKGNESPQVHGGKSLDLPISDSQDLIHSKSLSPRDGDENLTTISNSFSGENLHKNDEILMNVSNALQILHSEDKSVKISTNKPKKDIIPVYQSHLSSKDLQSKLNALKNQVLQDSSGDLVTGAVDEKEIEKSEYPPLPENAKGAWGSHIKKSSDSEVKSGVRHFRERTASFQLTEKLFVKSQFKSKRNPLKPRVPLRRAKSECFSLLSQNEDSNSIPLVATESQPAPVSTSQPSTAPVPSIDHDADQDPFSFDLFSTSKCKVTVKDSSQNISQSAIIPSNRKLVLEPNRSLDPGWISRCTGTMESSPIVDFIAQTKEDETTSLKILEKTSKPPPVPKFVDVPVTPLEISSPEIPIPSSEVNHCSLNLISTCPISPEMFPNSDQEPIPSSDNDNEIVSDSDTEVQQKNNKRKAQESLSPQQPSKKKAKLTKTPGKKLTEKERLEKKVSDGRVNENFVRINLKKKIYVRGRKNTSYSKYKKMMYKKKQVGPGGECSTSRGNCFNCGEVSLIKCRLFQIKLTRFSKQVTGSSQTTVMTV